MTLNHIRNKNTIDTSLESIQDVSETVHSNRLNTKVSDLYYDKNKKWLLLLPVENPDNVPEIFKQNIYEDNAAEIKEKTKVLITQFENLEKENGVVTHTYKKGDKKSVDVHNSDGEVIGKLVYLSGYLHQVVEWKNNGLHGLTIFLTNEGFPYKILEMKNNKLDGTSYQFEEEGEYKGNLRFYSEFKNHHYSGLRLGWTPDGIPLRGCCIVTEPELLKGIP
jgi:antitoxin component YwqK of YwqJK toxin-antitoxin module